MLKIRAIVPEAGRHRGLLLLFWGVAAVSFLMLLAGCTSAVPPAPETAEAAVPVKVVEAYRGDVEVAVSFPGVLEPEMVVNVVPKTGGRVAEVRVKNGQEVPAGALLLRLEGEEVAAQLAQAEANLQLARVQFETAAKSLEDARILFQEEIISRQQFEQAETQYKVAAAQLAQAEAAVSLVRLQLDNTLLTAPMGGTVSGLRVNPGEMISPGMPVLSINRMETMLVRLALTEKDVGRLTVGQKVGVVVSAVSPEQLQGEITSISPVADPVSKTFEMKVALPNADRLLKAGMSAAVYAVVAVEKDTVIIPVEAVVTQQEQQVVFVVEEGLARLRPLTLGLENGTLVSVLAGVNAGEQVVVKGQHYLQDGTRVAVAAAAEGGAER